MERERQERERMCVCVMGKGLCTSHLNNTEMRRDDADHGGPLWPQLQGWGLVMDIMGNLKQTCKWE